MARGKVYTTAPLLYNDQGDPIPQYLDVSDKTDSPQGSFKPLTNDPQDVRLTGSIVQERLTPDYVIPPLSAYIRTLNIIGTKLFVYSRFNRAGETRFSFQIRDDDNSYIAFSDS